MNADKTNIFCIKLVVAVRKGAIAYHHARQAVKTNTYLERLTKKKEESKKTPKQKDGANGGKKKRKLLEDWLTRIGSSRLKSG